MFSSFELRRDLDYPGRDRRNEGTAWTQTDHSINDLNRLCENCFSEYSRRILNQRLFPGQGLRYIGTKEKRCLNANRKSLKVLMSEAELNLRSTV
jgi:hypothetical protein